MTRRRAIRWSVVAGLPILLVVLLILLWNWDWFIPLVEARASAAAGRKITLAHLHLGLGRVTRIVADDVVVQNPAGFTAPAPLARADHLTVLVDVVAYIRDRVIVIPQIDLDHPTIDAVSDATGKSNYLFASSGPSSGGAEPKIGRLTIGDGKVHFADPGLRADVDLTVATQPASVGVRQDQADEISVQAKGTYAGQAVTGRLVAGALLSLRDTSHPYPVELHLANGSTTIDLTGSVQDPLEFKGTSLKLTLAGDDMADLFPLTGIAIPKTPKYRIAGDLSYADRRVRFENFAGTVGSSDLEGAITESPGDQRPDVTMDLRSRRVNLADLGGFINSEPGSKSETNATPAQKQALAAAEASPSLLPTKPFNLPKLKAADIHLKYAGAHIEGQSVPFDRIDATLDIVDGAITLHPISLGVGTGAIAGDVALTPLSDTQIRAKADIKFDKLNLSRLMASTQAYHGDGLINGRATLDADGDSIATWLGHGNGAVNAYMLGGDLSALLVDLSGLQFGKAALSALGLPSQTRIDCFVGDFGLQRGIVNTKALLLDTGEAVVSGKGTVNLDDQRIDYSLQSKSKHFSIGALPTPITITGTLKHPSIGLGLKDLAIRGGAAVALGFLAPPLALLPTIDLGTGDTNRCQSLIGTTIKAASNNNKSPGKSAASKPGEDKSGAGISDAVKPAPQQRQSAGLSEGEREIRETERLNLGQLSRRR